VHQNRTSALHPKTHGNSNIRHNLALTEKTAQNKTASQAASRKTSNSKCLPRMKQAGDLHKRKPKTSKSTNIKTGNTRQLMRNQGITLPI